MTSTITVEIGGTDTTGDTITIDPPSKGTVGAVTEVGDGVYTATYTAPSRPYPIFSPELSKSMRIQLPLVNRASTLITLLPVPTTVTVELGKDSFIADTPEETTVTVTVAAENVGPVTDENRHACAYPPRSDRSPVQRPITATAPTARPTPPAEPLGRSRSLATTGAGASDTVDITLLTPVYPLRSISMQTQRGSPALVAPQSPRPSPIATETPPARL